MYFAGTISATGGTAISNNSMPSGPNGPFALPPQTKSFYLQPDSTGVAWALFAGRSLGASFACATGTAALLGAPNTIQGPFRCGPNPVISVLSIGGGRVNVKVFTSPTG